MLSQTNPSEPNRGKFDSCNSSTALGVTSPYALPALPNAESALKPVITAKIMTFDAEDITTAMWIT